MNVRLATTIATAALAVALTTAPASASLIWEFGFTGPEINGFSGSGSFELSGNTGNSLADLVDFSYSGNCGGPQCDLALADVVFATWKVDTNWAFTALDLTAISGDETAGNPLFQLTINPNFLVVSCQSMVNECGGFGEQNRFGQFGSDATLSPVHENVPAPATIALVGLGLAGLGWSRRKQHS